MKVKLSKAGKVYTITFDEEGTLDTVACNGEFLVSTNTVVKQILNNEEKIRRGFVPAGFTKG